MSTVKTMVHAYRYDTSNAIEAAAWETLKAELTASHPHRMHSLTMGDSYYEAGKKLAGLDVIELETEHLFDNQWNTAPMDGHNGYRVFDWAQDALFHGNKWIKQGYYLDQTEEMKAVRKNTMACGYCGKQESVTVGNTFCPHCLDSAYLKQSDLKLLRMRPVIAGLQYRSPELSEAESAYLLPRYKAAQMHGSTERGKARIAKARKDVADKFASAVKNAEAEFKGFTWLMDQGINTENVIYYNHTGRFGFGWRTPVDEGFKDLLLEAISEFPYPYDIKCADGKTLSGG